MEQAAIVSACALELAPIERRLATIDGGLQALDRLHPPPFPGAEELLEAAREDVDVPEATATPARAAAPQAPQSEAPTEKLAHPKALLAPEAVSLCEASLCEASVSAFDSQAEAAPEAPEADTALEAEATRFPEVVPKLEVESVANAELSVANRYVEPALESDELPEVTAVANTTSTVHECVEDGLALSALMEPEVEADPLATAAPSSPAMVTASYDGKSCERPRPTSVRRPIASPARSCQPLRMSGEPAPLLAARCLSFEALAATGSPVAVASRSKHQAIVPNAPGLEATSATEARMPTRRQKRSCGDMSPAAA